MTVDTTNITIRTNKQLKQQAEKVFKDLGLNMTTAMTIFMKAVVREGGIPFELKTDPFYSAENLKHLNASIKELEQGRGIMRELIEE